MPDYTNAIIIGAGASGIAMAYRLTEMGFKDFVVYDKMAGIGGTWFANTYPGCGCDVPSHLYSFSFALNPNWSKALCEQPEILQYMNDVVDKFDLRGYFELQIECLEARWIDDEKVWEVTLKNMASGHKFKRKATVFISAVGGISNPKYIDIPGQDSFTGSTWVCSFLSSLQFDRPCLTNHAQHSARWDHTFDYTGKRLAVIGNGCSASQIVPKVVQKASSVTQYTRSAQWYHERPNENYSTFQKSLFKYIPFYQRYLRFSLFATFEGLTVTYGGGEKAAKERIKVEAQARKYTLDNSPAKYHSFIVPDFPLGCKRRVFDPDYLQSLSSKNLLVTTSKIKEIDGSAIVTQDGSRQEFDAICYATGFQVTEFLLPMKVYGRGGVNLSEKWKESGGAVAYKGVTVAGFPNMAILFGPNTFLAHNSAIFIIEIAVDYTIRNMMKPIIDKRATSIDVKPEAESFWATKTQADLQKMVWSSGCTNWNLDASGRNTASYPGTGMELWVDMLKWDFGSYVFRGGDKWWVARRFKRLFYTYGLKTSTIMMLMVALFGFKAASKGERVKGLRSAAERAAHYIRRLLPGGYV